MPTKIQLSVNSSAAEDVAIKTAWDTFLAAVKSATAKHVDVGGTVINGVKQTSDESGGKHTEFGTAW